MWHIVVKSYIRGRCCGADGHTGWPLQHENLAINHVIITESREMDGIAAVTQIT